MISSTEINREEEPSLVSKVLKVVTYPIAAASGYFVTKTHMSDSAFDTLKDLGAFGEKDKNNQISFDSKLGEHRKKKAAIVAHANKKIDTGQDATGMVEELRQVKRDFNPEVTTHLRKMGVKSIIDDWKIINKSQRARAITEGLTVAGVAIGALLTIANSKTISHGFKEIDEEKNQTPER